MKLNRVISIVLCAAMLAGIGLAQLPADGTKLADIVSDGEITANDALGVLHFSVGITDADTAIGKEITA